MNDGGLGTLVCDIEAIINARPLTKISDDPIDMNALTPNYPLIVKSNQSSPPGVFNKSDQYNQRR